jgi:diacylglycerol kinase (ATP)
VNPPPPPPPRDLLVFTSPKAGSGIGRGRIVALIEMLRSRGLSVEETSDVAQLCRSTGGDSPSRPDMVVAAGGDGTLSLVVQKTPPENLVSKQFGISSEAGSMLDMLMRGKTSAIDAGVANGRLFLVMVTCGFDAEVVRAMHLTRRGHISRFSYLGPTLRAIQRYRFPELRVTIPGDQTPIVCRWAMAFNLPRYAAGLDIEPAAVGNDGRLDLCAFQNGSVLSGFRYLAGIVLKRHSQWPDVLRRSFTDCEISSSVPVAYQVDGDYGGKIPVKIGILPGRVRLRLPPSAT